MLLSASISTPSTSAPWALLLVGGLIVGAGLLWASMRLPLRWLFAACLGLSILQGFGPLGHAWRIRSRSFPVSSESIVKTAEVVRELKLVEHLFSDNVPGKARSHVLASSLNLGRDAVGIASQHQHHGFVQVTL